MGEDALLRALRDRIRLVMAVADDLGHEKLVLGAFGCRRFLAGTRPWWRRPFATELARGTHAAREVVFAVPRGRLDENLEVFEHALATFPEVNGVPYVSRAERAAAEAERGRRE